MKKDTLEIEIPKMEFIQLMEACLSEEENEPVEVNTGLEDYGNGDLYVEYNKKIEVKGISLDSKVKILNDDIAEIISRAFPDYDVDDMIVHYKCASYPDTGFRFNGVKLIIKRKQNEMKLQKK